MWEIFEVNYTHLLWVNYSIYKIKSHGVLADLILHVSEVDFPLKIFKISRKFMGFNLIFS